MKRSKESGNMCTMSSRSFPQLTTLSISLLALVTFIPFLNSLQYLFSRNLPRIKINSNYHPISNISLISKMIEHTVKS